jgi:peptide/nickel transport system substrate-binding protein
MSHTSLPWAGLGARAALALLLSGGLALAWLPADGPAKKTPIKEEEEDPGPRPKKKIVDPDDDPPTPLPPSGKVTDPDEKKGKGPDQPPPVAATVDLARAAEEAERPEVRQLFRALAVPHDVIAFKHYKGEAARELWVERLPEYARDPRELGEVRLRMLGKDGKRLRTEVRRGGALASVRYDEELALAEVERFLRAEAPGLPVAERLQGAEQALRAVLNRHRAARLEGKRRGPGWDELGAQLQQLLLDRVLLERLELFAKTGAWEAGLRQAEQIVREYRGAGDRARTTNAVRKLVRLALADATRLADDKKEALTEGNARALLARLSELRRLEDMPWSAEVGGPLTAELGKVARGLARRARALEKKEPKETALFRNLVRAVRPDLAQGPVDEPEKEKERQQVLRVGVRALPTRLAPGEALEEEERQALELLFEPLVRWAPDEKGIWQPWPGLSGGLPRVVPLGRALALDRKATWSSGEPVLVEDVRFTVERMQEDRTTMLPRAWADELTGVEVERDSSRLRVLLRRGHPSPLSLLSFKVLPHASRADLASGAFTANPVGSGPYRPKEGKEPLGVGAGKARKEWPCLRFEARPDYRDRAGKARQPHFREVWLVAVPDEQERAALLKKGELDLALGLGAKAWSGLRDAKKVVTLPREGPRQPWRALKTNRRIYFLAINNGKGALADAGLRLALARVIDREALLKAHFRDGQALPVHQALNGPYPAGTWACDPKLPAALYDLDRAKRLFEQVRARRRATVEGELTLYYPKGDERVARAMEELVKGANAALPGLSLKAKAVDAEELRTRVERNGDYDLAYYHHDYLDETFWLMPLLGPSGRPDGRNYLNYSGPLVGRAQEVAQVRNFMAMRDLVQALHRDFHDGWRPYRDRPHEIDGMPFIPLWQLTPLLAHREEVRVVPFDAHQVFAGVGAWSRRPPSRGE